jgi:hypothetical protein
MARRPPGAPRRRGERSAWSAHYHGRSRGTCPHVGPRPGTGGGELLAGCDGRECGGGDLRGAARDQRAKLCQPLAKPALARPGGIFP